MLFGYQKWYIFLLSSTEEWLQCKSLREKYKLKKTHMQITNSSMYTFIWAPAVHTKQLSSYCI